MPPATDVLATRVPAPLAARGALVIGCALLSAVTMGPVRAALPAVLFVVLAVFASVPVPDYVPSWLRPTVEAGLAAALVTALGDGGAPFLAYLLAPCVAGGMGGLAAGLTASATAVLTLTFTRLGTAQDVASARDWLTDYSSWFLVLVASALLATWSRRIREPDPVTSADTAYRDAHRLLAELHVVARQLTLGLDPGTLATTLVEDVRAALPDSRATVLSRTDGGRFVELAGDEDDQAHSELVEEAWASGEPVTSTRGGVTVHVSPIGSGVRISALLLVTTTAREPDLSVVATTVQTAGPRVAAAMMFDEVRRLATHDERLRLARDIHDGVAQDLASLGYLVDDLRADADPEVRERLSGLREEIARVTGDLRLSLFDLRSGVDESVGLGAAISEHAQGVGTQAGIVVHAVVDEVPERLPRRTEVELFRITQEALTNVRRHSGARNVWVECRVRPPHAVVRVMDDGRWREPTRPDSMGVAGMTERAERIGAVLSVGPRPDGRTVVEVRIGPRGATPDLTGEREVVASEHS